MRVKGFRGKEDHIGLNEDVRCEGRRGGWGARGSGGKGVVGTRQHVGWERERQTRRGRSEGWVRQREEGKVIVREKGEREGS